MPTFWEERTGREKALLALIAAIVIGLGGYLLTQGGDEVAAAFDGGTPHTAEGSAASSTTGETTPVVKQVKHPKLKSGARDPFTPLVGPKAQPSPPPEQADETNEPKRNVTLNDVFTESGTTFASFTIDGTSFIGAEGETVIDGLKIVSLSVRCGAFDTTAGRIGLCVGQSIEV